MFSAVQIKSNSVQDHAPYRWCSAPSGERLPGREKDRGLGVVGETDMTCACSQKRWELEQEKVMLKDLESFFNVFSDRNGGMTLSRLWRWRRGRM